MTCIYKTIKGLIEDFVKDIDLENCNKELELYNPDKGQHDFPKITVFKDHNIWFHMLYMGKAIQIWRFSSDGSIKIETEIDENNMYPSLEELTSMVKDTIEKCTAIEGKL